MAGMGVARSVVPGILSRDEACRLLHIALKFAVYLTRRRVIGTIGNRGNLISLSTIYIICRREYHNSYDTRIVAAVCTILTCL
jgi:hypothetical protein